MRSGNFPFFAINGNDSSLFYYSFFLPFIIYHHNMSILWLLFITTAFINTRCNLLLWWLYFIYFSFFIVINLCNIVIYRYLPYVFFLFCFFYHCYFEKSIKFQCRSNRFVTRYAGWLNAPVKWNEYAARWTRVLILITRRLNLCEKGGKEKKRRGEIAYSIFHHETKITRQERNFLDKLRPRIN